MLHTTSHHPNAAAVTHEKPNTDPCNLPPTTSQQAAPTADHQLLLAPLSSQSGSKKACQQCLMCTSCRFTQCTVMRTALHNPERTNRRTPVLQARLPYRCCRAAARNSAATVSTVPTVTTAVEVKPGKHGKTTRPPAWMRLDGPAD